jgi:hypothetical protein
VHFNEGAPNQLYVSRPDHVEKISEGGVQFNGTASDHLVSHARPCGDVNEGGMHFNDAAPDHLMSHARPCGKKQ